jgi:outer membrane protein W
MKRIITSLIVCLSFNLAYSQNAQLNTQIEVGGLRGIQLSKTFPILKSGALAEISVTKSLGDYVQLGVGAAYLQLESEEFIPLFLQCRAHKKSQSNSPYFTTSIGYTKARNSDFENAIYNNYIGRVYFSPGIGYYYQINEKWGLSAGLSYIMQKVDLEHLNTNGQVYHTESLTLDLISFKVGISFH